MTVRKPFTPIRLFTVVLSAILLVTMLVPTPAAEAQGYYSSPCPHYSLQDVLDDLHGDWDHDGVRNGDELYNGINPCLRDSAAFCAGGGNPLCTYRTTSHHYGSQACINAVNVDPHGDWDGDGVANSYEVANGTNPCHRPCPSWTYADVALNPYGNWDSDGVNNVTEHRQGTNPCDGYSYLPCPHWSHYQVRYMPHADWDHDGYTNEYEVKAGTNPCVKNIVQRLPHVTTYVAPQRIPHVTTIYVAPPPRPKCPHGYPYYHPGNGLCYANPVGYGYAYHY